MSENLHLILGNKAYSSWSLRPWIALRVVEIEFTETVINLYDDDFKEKISQFSKAGKVPVLKDGGITVWESLAILDYLADKFPEKNMWPSAPDARAFARSISSEMHAGFQNIRSCMPMSVRRKLELKAEAEGLNAEIARILYLWNECRKKFGQTGPFLFGEFSIADAMYAPVVSRFATYGVKLDDISAEYGKAILNLPAMRQWYTEAEQEPWVAEKYE